MMLFPPIPRFIGRVVHGGVSSIRPVGWARTRSFQRGFSLIASLVAPLLLSSAGVGLAQTVDTTLWVTNGGIGSIVRDGSTIYIGGQFTRVGPSTGSFVAIDAGTGAAQQPYAKVAGAVYAVAPDGSGGWYLGGDFREVRGQPRNNLAHLDAGGNLTAWNPIVNGRVNALAVSGGTVYAGGYFSSIGGQPRNGIAALDATTGAATAWDPNASGIYHSVYALAVSGSTVYTGGDFTSIGGQPRNHIAALDATTGAATAWDPNSSGGIYNTTVYALAVSGSTVYAGGDFTSIGGQTRNNIAALNATTGAATAWNPNASSYVLALAVSGTTVYAGGNFLGIGGATRNYVAALRANTGAATAWGPNANGVVRAVAVSVSTVYAGGDFTSIGGQPRNRIAALDATTGAPTAWNPNPSSYVLALAVSGGTIYAGGYFSIMGGQTRNNIAALDAATGAATDWNPNADKYVGTLAVSGGTVYACGGFTSIGGQPRNRIAALDATTGAATTWNPNAPNPNDEVTDLAVSGSTVYASGFFTSIGGQPRNYLAALDATTGAATAWNPNPNSYVDALAVSGGTVYTAGGFTSIGGQPRNYIAALDAATGVATAWDPNAYGPVSALLVSGGTVYAGGLFTNIGGQPRNGIAALDAASGAATTWDPNASGGALYTSPVSALAVSGGTVYAGGSFTTIGGQTRNNIAALDATTGAATAWNPNANSYVDVLTVSGGTVYAGGSFGTIGGQLQSSLAAISEGNILSVSGDPGTMEGSLTVAPNPTRAAMQIQYAVTRAGRVRLDLLDVSGRVEATLADRVQEPGRYVASWDVTDRGEKLSPGVHFVRFVAPDQVMVKKLAIIQ